MNPGTPQNDRNVRDELLRVAVDMLNRSLLSDFLPVQMLRAAGLHVLSALPPLRNVIMREGIEPGRLVSSWLVPSV